jgi:hypothetical protein
MIQLFTETMTDSESSWNLLAVYGIQKRSKEKLKAKEELLEMEPTLA